MGSAQAMGTQVERERIGKMRDEGSRYEITVEGLTTMARENREIRSDVVRDLSWELARYLDTEKSFSATASATSNSMSE
jgi:hypothetical protein